MRCGLGRSGRLHSDEYMQRTCPQLEDLGGWLRETMQDWASKIEELDPSAKPLTERFRRDEGQEP